MPPSGLVGDIVLSPIGDDPQRQFARTPYTASFSRARVEFTLASVHILWGKNPADRLPEVTAFARWMHDWAVRPNDWNSNLIVLGDFNLDRIGHPLYETFVSTGLWPPTELNAVPRTIFDDDKSRHFYDQMAWFSEPDDTSLLRGLAFGQRAGTFDFIAHIFWGLSRTEGMAPTITRLGASSCSPEGRLGGRACRRRPAVYASLSSCRTT